MLTEIKAAPAAIADTSTSDVFVTVPQTTLPCGMIVPSFQVGQYAASKDDGGQLTIVANRKPWVNINYFDAAKACLDAGYQLITETQWLAIAHDVVNVDANWTKGKVGQGKLFRGLRKGNVNEAQAGDFAPADQKERRWLTLSNGQQICDINGNVWQWVFDDLHGDGKGIINKPFTATDPTITTAPYPSCKNGMGWRPDGERNWSGRALVRGGDWGSSHGAGVFCVLGGWPRGGRDVVGFRCTKSL